MKLFVTGGCGFMGSNFIRYTLNIYSDVQILNFDKLTYAGNPENLRDLENDQRYKFLQGDIVVKDQVEKAIVEFKPDQLVNFAAESISKNTYLPIWNTGKIQIVTLEDLFNRFQKNNRIEKRGIVEMINLHSTNYKVLSYKGGIGYWMPVRQISRHKYKGKILRLQQKWGEIEVTPNHSIYDSDFNLTTPLKNPELLGLRNINHISKKDIYEKFSGKRLQALLRIFAAYIAEGWTSHNKKNGSYHFGITNKDKEWILALRKDLAYLNYKPNVTYTKDGLYQLIISNKGFFHFVREEAGFGSHGKCIPSFVFQLKKSIIEKYFFRTLIFGDGEIIQNKTYQTIRYTTVSKNLATGLSLLATLLGYNYAISKDKRSDAYLFKFGGDYTISLLSKKIEKIEYDDYVYDISVDTLKNFVCGIGNIVVHNTHVDRSIMDPAAFLKTDVFGTYNLLEVARHHNLRMIQVSTDEVYGAIEQGEAAEDAPYVPRSPYSASKASGDHLCHAYFVTYGTPVIVTHSCNFYGPYQYPEKLIPLFITNLLEDKKVPVYGDGLQVREWIFTEDYCRALDTILQRGKSGEMYNIGTGFRVPNLEVVRKILAAVGKDESYIEYVKDRPGHDRRYAVSHKKLERELGWHPNVSFEEGIIKTVEWYKKNTQWWRPLKSGEFAAYYKSWYADKLNAKEGI